MTRILLIIILSAFFMNVHGQSNDYFKHGEGWSEVAYGGDGNVFYSFVYQVGDTIINNDTLVKLKNPYTVSDTSYMLAKSNLGILTMYYSTSDFSTIGDSMIVDYSRTDSITQYAYNSMSSVYSAKAINSIDTVYFGSVAKKIFNVTDDCSFSGYEDYVYEGIPGFYESCFEYIHLLICYSISDSSYQVDFNTFNSFSGTCSLHLGMDEISSPEKKLVKIVNLMGQEVMDNPNDILIYVYDDGSTEKIVRIE